MAITPVSDTNTFIEWKDITNLIIVALGDNLSLNTTDKTNAIAAINEVLAGQGDITTLTTTIKTSNVAAVNELDAEMGDLATLDATFLSPSNLIAALNNLVARIGVLASLSTTIKTNLVSAINEVLAAQGNLSALTTTDKSTYVAAINELDAEIGDLTSLNTTDKTSLIAATNEVLTAATTVSSELGDITTLNTTDKTSNVAATNEVLAKQGDISTLNTTDKTTNVAAINEVLVGQGDITALTTTIKTSTVVAINELDADVGPLVSLNTSDKTSLIAATNEVLAKQGDITTLTTTNKASNVAAINELDNDVGVLTTLTTFDKTSTVAAINEVDGDVGVLTTLNTTDKTTSVAAINELVAQALLFAKKTEVPTANLVPNFGKQHPGTFTTLGTFADVNQFMQPINSSVITAGLSFPSDSTTYGGTGAALTGEALTLYTRLTTEGRGSPSGGVPFFITNIAANVDGAPTDVINDGGNNYQPLLWTGTPSLDNWQVGRYSDAISFTIEFWLSINATNAVTSILLVGDIDIDGVAIANQAGTLLVQPGVANTWFHFRQYHTRNTDGYIKYAAGIYADVADDIKVALPSAYAQEYRGKAPLGPVS